MRGASRPTRHTASDPLNSIPRLRPFVLWLAAFYSAWLALVFFGNHWATVAAHWPIAVAMAAGSYFAGSTPMGGGTVGFPVLVLLFDLPGTIGRNFGLAVQSIGMVSASIYLFAARRPLAWNLLRPALLGALLATPLGAALVAPRVPDLGIKLVFAIVWAAFGMLHLVKLKELVAAQGILTSTHREDRIVGLAIGIVGGVLASITGVGIDMVLYAAMVLLYRADLKLSIPTSVVLMAFTSVVGIASNVFLAGLHPAYAISPEVFGNWIAAAPVVALGAPIGAIVVNWLPRAPTLIVVSVLCVGQFFWTILHEQLTPFQLAASFAALGVVNLGFHVIYKWGLRRAQSPKRRVKPHEPVRLDSEI